MNCFPTEVGEIKGKMDVHFPERRGWRHCLGIKETANLSPSHFPNVELTPHSVPLLSYHFLGFYSCSNSLAQTLVIQV